MKTCLLNLVLLLPCCVRGRIGPYTTTLEEEKQDNHNNQQQSSQALLEQEIPPRYTPEPSDWSGIYAKTLLVPTVYEHTPAGVGWIGQDDWDMWDGQVIDPTQYKDAAS